MENIPLFITLFAGVTHALEADHVLAITNIVSQRKTVLPAVKDGICWGLGHTSTILLVGIIVLVFKASITDGTFSYFEAAVGLMLIIIAVLRLIKFYQTRKVRHDSGSILHARGGAEPHVHTLIGDRNLNKVSYGIGLVHGLAGSGVLLALAMTQFIEPTSGMIYLLMYGLGSVVGMALVSGFFSIPFSRSLINSPVLRNILTLFSSIVCIVYGAYVIYVNLS